MVLKILSDYTSMLLWLLGKQCYEFLELFDHYVHLWLLRSLDLTVVNEQGQLKTVFKS